MAELVDRVGKAMTRTKDEFPTDWPRNWRTLSNRFNWGDNGLAYKQLNAADAAECLRMLRSMRGEAEPEDIGMTNAPEADDKAEAQDSDAAAAAGNVAAGAAAAADAAKDVAEGDVGDGEPDEDAPDASA